MQPLAFCVRGRTWLAAESSGLWSGASRATHYYPQPLLLLYSMTLTAEMGLNPWSKKFRWSCHLCSPLTTCYQYVVYCKYCVLCVQIVWLLDGANLHEAPWKPYLFTSIFWSGQWIKVAFKSTAIIKIYFWTRLIPFKKQVIVQSHVLNNAPAMPSEACWSHQVEG